MYIRDMKPNTAYATQDGRMMVTGEKVEGGWICYLDLANNEFKIVKGEKPVEVGSDDPWATKKRRRHNDVVARGIRVTEHSHDAAGNPLTEDPEGKGRQVSRETVIAPRELVGLWSDYVKLHGDRIAAPFIRKGHEDAARELSLAHARVLRHNGFLGLEKPKFDRSSVHVGERCEAHVKSLYKVRVRRDGVDVEEWSNWPQLHDGIVAAMHDPEITLRGEAALKFLGMLDQPPPLYTEEQLETYKVSELRTILRKLPNVQSVAGVLPKQISKRNKAQLISSILVAQQ
jgi:hypothetical protein